MSFREKSAWISILTMGVIYSGYFWSLNMSAGSREGLHSVGALIRTIILLGIAQIVLHVVVAIQRPAEAAAPLDERERTIGLAATRIAYYGLASGVVVACLFGALNPPLLFSTNSLLFILVAAEMLRAGSQIVLFRLNA